MKKVVLVAFCFLAGLQAIVAQTTASNTLKWSAPATYRISDDFAYGFLGFEGSSTSGKLPKIPMVSHSMALTGGYNDFNVTVVNVQTQPLTTAELAAISPVPPAMPEVVTPEKNIIYLKGKPRAVFSFSAILYNKGANRYEKVLSYQYTITPTVSAAKQAKSTNANFVANSVLASGRWYKIAVTADGIYKIDQSFLTQLGMDVGGINPNNIRIYGNGGGMLPTLNSAPRIDDLSEVAIEVSGAGDNSFDSGDFILFYGQNQVRWKYNTGDSRFVHTVNNYSDTTYYFITADLGPGKRVGNQQSEVDAVPTYTATTFNDYALHEDDKVNVIKSGSQWFGETFDIIDSYSFGFSFPNLVTGEAVKYYSVMGTNSKTVPCLFTVKNGGIPLGNTPVSVPAATGSYDEANTAVGNYTFSPSSSFNITITKNTAGCEGWLDYIELNAKRYLQFSGSQMIYRNADGTGPGQVIKYQLSNANNVRVWDVTDHQNVTNQQFSLTGGMAEYVLPADVLHEFIAFNGGSFGTPIPIGGVANQNLHANGPVDMIIVAHPNFMGQANRLADMHRNMDNLSVLVVTPQEIYNEFSSGAADILAIRGFARMFYKRATNDSEKPKYMLLFGDGSYDNKGNIPGNSSFVPTYQTYESTNVISSQTSDDYYGVLDDNEGNFLATEAVDIGLGRIPCKSVEEAKNVVDKIADYESIDNTVSLRDWRNMVTFIADDQDSNTHQTQANGHAIYIDTKAKSFNLEKILLDAYVQESTAGGQRYPDAKNAINQRVNRGGLIVNYTGHGGEAGWAGEKILELGDIDSWTNRYALPAFVTATCEFSKFDDPGRTSAGELVLLRSTSGGICLFTTTRVVYSGPNDFLNGKFYQAFLSLVLAGERPRMGDLYRATKDSMAAYNDYNSRNFTLLGDPAVRIKYPIHDVVTTLVNGQVITGPTDADTIKALQLVTVKGEIRNRITGQKITSYNGVLYPTIFDKPIVQQTLGNDPDSPIMSFKTQRNIIYKGKASVVNGEWTFTFPVPKDIAYQFDIGKISYYAENGVRDDDAHGYQLLVIGGTDTAGFCDNLGPNIRLYMNNSNFANGGITDANPILLAFLADTNGINTVGSGIGHDITAILDNNNSNPYILNDYYESDLNSYTSGSLRYAFTNLTDGAHTLRVKGWDICNNSSEATLDFVVARNADIALDHVLNYPNPFTTNTCFMFEHNRPNSVLDVQVQVFTVSGKLVKTINTTANDAGYRTSCIPWDGLDDYGDKIGRGVYIYRVKITDEQGKKADKYEKLVILN